MKSGMELKEEIRKKIYSGVEKVKSNITIWNSLKGDIDTQRFGEVMQLLKKVAENNLVIVVSHDPEEAEVYADRIIRIKDGKLAEDTGSKESVFEARPFEMVHRHLGFIASLIMCFKGVSVDAIGIVIGTSAAMLGLDSVTDIWKR